jgi:ferredoxin
MLPLPLTDDRPVVDLSTAGFALLPGVDAADLASDRPGEFQAPLADIVRRLGIKPRRWTCDPIDLLLDGTARNPRRLILNLLDPDAQTHLSAAWSIRQIDHLASAIDCVATSLDVASTIVVIDQQLDKSSTGMLRSAIRRASGVVKLQEVEPVFPLGHAGILRHEISRRDACAVIDPILLFDLFHVARGQGVLPAWIPTAIRVSATRQTQLFVARRDTTIAAIAADCGLTRHSLLAGAALRGLPADPAATLASGELVFHAIDPRAAPLPEACVECGWCVDLCPTRCRPFELFMAVAEGDESRARSAGLTSCIDCGICSAICPSHIPLHPGIRAGVR